MSARRSVVIWGSGGHGREVALVCRQSAIHVAGFIDDRPEARGMVVEGIPVLGSIEDVATHASNSWSFFPGGVGDPALKRLFATRIAKYNLRFAEAIVHPGADVGDAVLGCGAFVANGVIMTTNVHVGDHVCVNRAVNVSHDVTIESFATVAPGVQLSGNVVVGQGAQIGVGASVRERVQIGAGAIVGGGSFVARDVLEATVVGGVPARKIAGATPSRWAAEALSKAAYDME